MTKRRNHFQRIEKVKELCRKLSTEKLLYRISQETGTKEHRIACREILAERGVDVEERPIITTSKKS